MNLYDNIIQQIDDMLINAKRQNLQASKIPSVKNNMIFRSDVAFELGGDKIPAISLTLPSSTIEIEDSIYLIGNDLCDIKKDNPIARISILQIKETDKTADALYNMVKRLDFTKYHVSPEGYMMRISSTLDKEVVRVSKKAIQNKISFQDVGYHFIDAFSKHHETIAIKQIFITDPNFDYDKLKELSKQSKEYTNLIDHMLKDLDMNCNTCHLKVVCDEVDGMKELHSNSTKPAE